jgi:hypothetical protein
LGERGRASSRSIDGARRGFSESLAVFPVSRAALREEGRDSTRSKQKKKPKSWAAATIKSRR